MPKKFSSRRKKIRRAENFFCMLEKKLGVPKIFLAWRKKLVAMKIFMRILGTPKIFSARRIFMSENWACRKIFWHDEKNSSRWKFSWEFWARRKFFRRDEFLCQKIGHAEKFLSCRKWKGIISACPIFALYPGLALIHSTLIDDLCQINTPLCSSLMTRVVKSLLNQQESSKDLT